MDAIVPHRDLSPPRVRAPDVAADLHGVLPDSVRALRATRPRRLIAFACPEAGHPNGPDPRLPEHEVTRWCRLVRCAARRGEPAARPSPGATIVHAGAAYGSKRWPPGRFAAVARGLAAQGHDVVVTGSAAERDLAASVATEAGLPGTSCLAGRTGLSDLAALVHGAALVISGDTGVAHLASAYERPSVVLFGPASPRLWGPPDKPIHAALRHGDGEREVLADAPGPALLAITPGEVLEAAARVPGH